MKSLFLLLIFTVAAQAQQVKGTVVDSTGTAIENAYVVNIAKTTHAHTDEFGGFTVDQTVVGDTLEISSLGYKKLKFVTESGNPIIVLQDDILKLDQVIISDAVEAANVIAKIDLQTNPVNSSQEILRKVPGLFIGQHAGGGKAEQIFLRGFDIDHGTDIAVSVDGMPVNMVSHAHGHGYADLHCIIPEIVDKIEFGKGTYYASKGDFATAGYVAFRTKEKLDTSMISLEAGQFNTLRTFAAFNLFEEKNRNAYFATEYIMTDGPFISPQNFKRINLFGKFTEIASDKSKFSATVSHFTSNWDASGQIPQRLVNDGTLSRFGAVDDTEGGFTSRSNVNAEFTRVINENNFLKANAFYSRYELELYSNFTFFLEDSINGDQIKQKEGRNIYGLNSELNSKFRLFNTNSLLQTGFGFRADETSNSELSHTANRVTTLEVLKLGDIDQVNFFGYSNLELNFGKFRINPALRIDYFKFTYRDKLDNQTLSENKVKFSPKLNFIYSHNNNLQLYLKNGLGFHSNDTRVVVSDDGKKTLPTAFGSDLGLIAKASPRFVINAALWYLFLEQEFVYVGDAAVVEPSGRSRRMGIDLGLRYQIADWLFFDTDVNYTYARSIDEPSGFDLVPLAPAFTSTGGLSISKLNGFSGGFRCRYLADRPANEDNSIVAEGYFISDLNLNYETGSFVFGVSVENIFDTEWNETQFATESRLQNEAASVEEIHFTPGTPFFAKARISYKF